MPLITPFFLTLSWTLVPCWEYRSPLQTEPSSAPRRERRYSTYQHIILAVGLQRWDTPSPHALAARDATGLAKGAGARLSVTEASLQVDREVRIGRAAVWERLSGWHRHTPIFSRLLQGKAALATRTVPSGTLVP